MSTTISIRTERGFIAVSEGGLDRRGLSVALMSEKSSTLKTKVGAALSRTTCLWWTGFNRNEEGKTVHAEVVALAKSKSILGELDRLNQCNPAYRPTMYITWIPCLSCAQEIIAAGIKRVVGINRLLPIEKQSEYNTKYKLNEALELLRCSGVEVTLYDEQSGWMQSESVTVLTPKSND